MPVRCFHVSSKNKPEAAQNVLLLAIIERFSAKELDVFHAKVFLPFSTDQKELSGYNIQELIQITLRNPAAIVRNDTLS